MVVCGRRGRIGDNLAALECYAVGEEPGVKNSLDHRGIIEHDFVCSLVVGTSKITMPTLEASSLSASCMDQPAFRQQLPQVLTMLVDDVCFLWRRSLAEHLDSRWLDAIQGLFFFCHRALFL